MSDEFTVGLPKWPAFSEGSQQVMYLDAKPGVRPVPNMPQLRTMDDYFASRREEAKARK